VSIHPAEPKILYCGDSGWVGLHSIQASQASQDTQAVNQQASGTRWQLHGDMLVTQSVWRPGYADQFATSSFDGNVRLWQLTGDTPQMLAEFPHPGRVRCIAFTPDGARIATGGEDPQIRVFDVNSLKQISTLAEHTGKVRSLAYTSDGRTLFSSANDASIITWELSKSDLSTRDLSNWKPSNIEHLSAISICSAVSPNGKWFVFGTEAGILGIRSLTGDAASKDIPVAKQWLRCVAISSDSQTLATGTQDGEIALWNLETGIKLAEFSKQSSPITSLSFSSDNRTLTAGLYSGQLVVWNVQ
jgi:WD40 repeat protein